MNNRNQDSSTFKATVLLLNTKAHRHKSNNLFFKTYFGWKLHLPTLEILELL